MDESDFDIIKCTLDKCPYYHLMLTEGYMTEKEARINMKMLIKTYNEKKEEQDKNDGTYKIIVNAQKIKWPNRFISYLDLLELIGAKGFMTVQYSRGVNGVSGTLIKGEGVFVIDGMIFNIADTSRA